MYVETLINSKNGEIMEYQEYASLKNELEVYFASTIKSRFKEHFSNSFEQHLVISADYETHRLIDELLEKDGFDVYGMNVNMDGFQLLLNFKFDYLQIEKFPFTRLSVDFSNDGNYNVYLGTDSFDDEWQIHIEDEFQRYRTTEKDEFESVLKEIKKVHLMLLLKRVT